MNTVAINVAFNKLARIPGRNDVLRTHHVVQMFQIKNVLNPYLNILHLTALPYVVRRVCSTRNSGTSPTNMSGVSGEGGNPRLRRIPDNVESNNRRCPSTRNVNPLANARTPIHAETRSTKGRQPHKTC